MSLLTSLLKTVHSPRIGLGCMNLSHGYGQPVNEDEGIHALEVAFDMGYRHFDTATLYGDTANERLLGRALASKRHALLLASKCGMAMNPDQGKKVIDGRPATLRKQCEDSLARLQTYHIDLYYLHRWDKNVPIEESVGELGRLVDEGKIRAIGLSEVSANTIKRAHAERPIAAVQSEYSLWTRNPEIGVLDACRALDIAFVAFSPLGRGFLSGAVNSNKVFDEGDMRRHLPRFNGANLEHNLQQLAQLNAIARQWEIPTSQLALAWLEAQGDDIIPIPGSRSVTHMRENLASSAIRLPDSAIAKVGTLFTPKSVAGERYAESQLLEVDTEQF